MSAQDTSAYRRGISTHGTPPYRTGISPQGTMPYRGGSVPGQAARAACRGFYFFFATGSRPVSFTIGWALADAMNFSNSAASLGCVEPTGTAPA